MNRPVSHFEPDTVLTIADAARHVGRSEAWVRTWRSSGQIEAAEIAGRQAVTVASLREFSRRRPKQRQRPTLRLVVDNTNP